MCVYAQQIPDSCPSSHSGIIKSFRFGTAHIEEELKIVCLGHPTNLEIKSAIFHIPPHSEYDKGNWELFWQTYNLTQFHYCKGVEKDQLSEEKEVTIDSLLENFRPELHEIVKNLIANGVSINTEYDFDLLEDEVIVAQAELGSISSKFFLYPFDEESRAKFIENGYSEFTIENFNASKL